VLRATGGDEKAAEARSGELARQLGIDPDTYLSREDVVRAGQALRGGQVAQAPATFGDRFGAAYGNPPAQVRQQAQPGINPAAEPKISDPTLLGLLKGPWVGRPQAYLSTLQQFMSDPNLPKNELENYKQQVEAINKALEQERGTTLKEPTVRGEKRAEHYAKKFETITTEGDKARDLNTTFDAAEQLMLQPGFYSGPAKDQVLLLKQAAAVLGFSNPDAASSVEAFRALGNKAVVDTLGRLGSGVSNNDAKLAAQASLTLENTPEGNRKLIGIMRRINERKLEIASMAHNYKDGNLDVGFDRMVAQYARDNPLFPKAERDEIARLTVNPAKGGYKTEAAPVIARPRSAAERDALPPNTPYLDPNGVERRTRQR
jgi:hypothetical protein